MKITEKDRKKKREKELDEMLVQRIKEEKRSRGKRFQKQKGTRKT